MIPKIKTQYGENIGIEILVSHPEISQNNKTFINTDSSSGASSFAVDNGLKFSIAQYILVGNITAEKTELLRTHDSTSPTSTTITLDATTSNYAHSRGDIITFIPYNQIEIYRSTDSGSTYSLLDTVNIRVDSENTYYNHTSGASTDYYKIRFKNETDTTYSQYSDGIIGNGYVSNSSGAIIEDALEELGEKIDGVLTKKYLFSSLTEGRREIDEDERIIRWEFRTVFGYNAYSVIPGQYRFTLPTNLREPSTNKNILNVRFGRNKYKVKYIDQERFDELYRGVRHTTLNGAITTADTSIILTNSGNFDTSGDIDIAAEDVDETIDSVSYTGNTLTTQTLTGVTGIRTEGHSDGVDVWKGATFGEPIYYTVDNGKIYFSQPFSDDIAGETVDIDYYKTITDINSDGDLLDEPFYNIYKPWMRYKIKKRLDRDLDWKNDPDYIEWEQKKIAQINKQYNGQDLRLNIDLPC